MVTLQLHMTNLVAKGVTPYDDGLDPPRDRLRDALQHDRLAEHCSAKDVTDLEACQARGRANGRQPRTVPLGERHICLSLNSSTRASSGVMVAHCRRVV
jgi:hypothetical protein